ncbi:MAG: O-antigen ligase family protein, partial [Candidatus Hydrogenedentales bacterium]
VTLWFASSLTVLAAMIAVVQRAGSFGSDMGRLEIWRIAYHSFLDRPLFGWGPDTFEVVMRRYIGESFVAIHGGQVVHPGAHNMILQVLYSTGVVGLLLLIVGVYMMGTELADVGEDDIPAVGASVALATCSLVNPVPTAALGALICLWAPMFRDGSVNRRGLTLAQAGACLVLLAV